MINQRALVAAAGAAAMTLVLALGAVALAPAVMPVDATDASTQPAVVDPAPTVQVDTIYLAAPQQPETIVVHERTRGEGDEDGEHEHEHEHESGDDD